MVCPVFDMCKSVARRWEAFLAVVPLMLVPALAAAQQDNSDIVPYSCITKQHPILEVAGLERAPSLPAENPQDKAYNCKLRLSRDPDYVNVYASAKENLIVRFLRGADSSTPISLKEAGFQKAELIADGNVLHTKTVGGPVSPESTALYVSLDKTANLDSYTTVELRLTLGTGAAQHFVSRYLVTHKWISYYGVAGKQIGLWFPIGLFVTNFRSTDAGLPIGAFPVGVALGLRWRPSPSFYLGVSAMVNWVAQPTSTAGSTQFNLATIAGGLLLDINNYVYVGPAYVGDLRAGQKDPGLSFVFGVAPGLLQLFQGRPSYGNGSS